MDETKVQIGNDVLLDIGTHSDWYISVICYNNESVNVELRRKIDRNNKWWVAEQTKNNSEFSNNCETCRFELYCPEMCEGCCEWDSHYEPKTEPTISKMEQVDKDINVRSKDEPQICDTCKYGEDKHKYAHICNECGVGINNYEPRTERNE